MTVWTLTLVNYRGRRCLLGVYASEEVAMKYRDKDILYHEEFSNDKYQSNDYDIMKYIVVDE